MLLTRNYKYRIYPTRKQEKTLQFILDECRWVYNKTLELRKNAWETEKKSISKYDTFRNLPKLKEERPTLKEVHSQVLQNACQRVEWTYQHFFRRVKKGEIPGYPRFKDKDRYHSFTYPQFGFKIKNERVVLSGVGSIKSKIHREIPGKLKTCSIKRSSTGKWYAVFSVEIESKSVVCSGKKSVGIDLGLKTFATLSDESSIENPRFFKKEQKNLTKIQRKLEKQKKCSLERKKRKKVVARIHERIVNKRHDFSHQMSHKIVSKYDIICMEKLEIQNMVNNNFRNINRTISDVAWNKFVNNVVYKAEEAGKRCILVDPKGTTQGCSKCGVIVPKTLDIRTHCCPHCNLSIDRDLNASLNILRLGLQSLASA